MKRSNTLSLSFDTLQLEGGLLLPDILERAAQGKLDNQKDNDYQIPKGLTKQAEYSRAFQIAVAQWKNFTQKLIRNDLDPKTVSRQFMIELLRDVLSYRELQEQSASIILNDRSYPIDVLAFGIVPIVIAPHNVGLDEAMDSFAITGGSTRKKSAFQLVQEFLNASDTCLWGIVCNGKQLRLLRDASTLTRPSFIEFDLQAILEGERYPDFAALWRLLHGALAGRDNSPEESTWEQWRKEGLQEGVRVREGLREGVERALLSLGEGFLEHPENGELRHDLLNGKLKTTEYYQQLLRLVYRLIFLFTVEERGLLHPDDTAIDTQRLTARKAYQQGYSQSRLRSRCMKNRAHDKHHDLWLAQQVVFSGLAAGQSLLDLPALGGLFATDQCLRLDSASLSNAAFLAAIKHLRWSNRSGQLAPIDYANMASEELGSVYEGLLELVPSLDIHARQFGFVGRNEDEGSTKGNARKLSGSYYTPDSLVQELIKSALEPVIKQRLEDNLENPIDALLSIKVLDPACGSGHFLLAAANRLAQEVAEYEAQKADGVVTPQTYRHALRSVISHCIYGVDKNPLAVELARTALWLEGYEGGKSLSFIDHHIRCGDALLGVLDPSVLEKGIPEKAYVALTGDSKDVAKNLKAENKKALKLFEESTQSDWTIKSLSVDVFDSLEELPDDDLGDVKAKKEIWQSARKRVRSSLMQQLADMYVAAFLMPKVKQYESQVPLSSYFWNLFQGYEEQEATSAEVDRFCQQAQVFHWWLEFPHIHAHGGFDVVLGNPPWERIKLQEQEFFAGRSPLIAEAKNKAEREQRIQWLKDGKLLHHIQGEYDQGDRSSDQEQALYQEFMVAKRGAEAASLFAHESGRFLLTGVGDVNTYALFAETVSQLITEEGRAGFIVPTGIATDDSTKNYFSHIAQSGRLVSLFSFENEEFIFPSVHHSFRFCLMTLRGHQKLDSPAQLLFFARQPTQIYDENRRFVLSPEDFSLINPNTKTCPVFRSQQDAELTKKLYHAAPILIEEGNPDINPWRIRFMRMLDMSTDSHLFYDENTEDLLPLYEAKMIHQFDHRWATYEYDDGHLDTRDCLPQEKSDLNYTVQPRYWIDKREVLARISDIPRKLARAWLNHDEDMMLLESARWLAGELVRQSIASAINIKDYNLVQRVEVELRKNYAWAHSILAKNNEIGRRALGLWPKWGRLELVNELTPKDLQQLQGVNAPSDLKILLNEWLDSRSPRWLMGWRDVTSSHVYRTMITAIVSRTGVGHKMPLFIFSRSFPKNYAALLHANLNSLVLDFIVRQKVGGVSLTYHYLKQFPVIAPSQYTPIDLEFIIPRVLELTFTSNDLTEWASDLGFHGTPFSWNEQRRAEIRAELDAYYARLYGLNRDELRYILDPADIMGENYPSETFRVLKNREVKDFGEYRTRRLVLFAFDRMVVAQQTQSAFESLLVPSPGHKPVFVYSSDGIPRSPSEAWLLGLILDIIHTIPDIKRLQLEWMIQRISSIQQFAYLLNTEEGQALLQLIPYDQAEFVNLSERLPLLIRLLKDEQLIRETNSVLATINHNVRPDWIQEIANTSQLVALMKKATEKHAAKLDSSASSNESIWDKQA